MPKLGGLFVFLLDEFFKLFLFGEFAGLLFVFGLLFEGNLALTAEFLLELSLQADTAHPHQSHQSHDGDVRSDRK